MSSNPNNDVEHNDKFIYELIDNTIIIGPDVNEPIDFGIFDEKITDIIFLNFYTNIKSYKYFFSELYFEKYIDNHNLATYTIYGSIMNNEILLTTHTQKLKLGAYYNRPINLVKSLTHLIFGHCFNQPINLTTNTDNLIYLIFGFRFSQPIELPESLVYLKVDSYYKGTIIFNNQLEYLSIGYWFGTTFTNLIFPNIKYLERCAF